MGKKNKKVVFRLAIDFSDEQSMRDFISARMGDASIGARPLDSLDGNSERQVVRDFIARRDVD